MIAWRREFDDITVVVGADVDVATVVADALGLDAASVVVSHSCPECGSAEHGRRIVVAPAGGVGLSIAHTGGIDAIAINRVGPIGVDLESVARVARSSVQPVLLHPREFADSAEDVARLWTTKEAVLKLAGHGLRVDPRELRVSAGRLVAWPSSLFPDVAPNILTFTVTDELVGALAYF